jgi:hypothetical protein
MESASRATPHAADRGRRTSAGVGSSDSSVLAGQGPAQGAAAIRKHVGHETGLKTAGTEHAAARYLL